jgi:hypothetical protein
MAGAILGHVTVSATNVYAHMQHDPSVTVADRVAGTIAAALEGKEGIVVPIRRGARGGAT